MVGQESNLIAVNPRKSDTSWAAMAVVNVEKNRQVIARHGYKMVEIPPKLGLYGMMA